MKHFKSNEINSIYYDICYELEHNAPVVGNTKELTNVIIELTDINNDIITSKGKMPSIKYLLAENIWYAYGSNDVNFISKFAKYWKQISDDGQTSNSAYGYIMRYKHGFNQILKIVTLLNKDRNTRRACIIINDANENVDTTKDEQCTMYLQFLIRDDKLHLTVNMRSNDVIYGLPYDIPAFIAIQKFVARLIGIGFGTYTHIATSMHYYLKDADKINKILTEGFSTRNFKLDLYTLYEMPWAMYKLAEEEPNTIVDFAKSLGIIKVYEDEENN